MIFSRNEMPFAWRKAGGIADVRPLECAPRSESPNKSFCAQTGDPAFLEILCFLLD
jgi:hypothetical protein